ncbi:MAG: DEAD/DEAH box helicase [Deltaproteobacteria bacterium]|jgi:ATP-dependent DNA helicase RecG|nr:DEAD/DEAH box helicase [Deltaproteobacteria bacterium]
MIPWPLNSPLSTPLAKRTGLGRTRLEILAKRGLITSIDLLAVPPVSYKDRRRVISVAEAEDRRDIVFIGRVVANRQGVSARGTPWLKVEVVDGDDLVVIWWFRSIPYYSQVARKGETLVIAGQIVLDDRGRASMTHPDICPAEKAMENFLGVKPVYRVYPGVPPATLKKVLEEILRDLPQCPPVLPPEWVESHGLMDPVTLLGVIHQPPPNPGPLPLPTGSRAYRRLATLELMFWRLLILTEKTRRAVNGPLRVRSVDLKAGEDFLAQLPFAPSPEQLRVAGEFIGDLASAKPLNRLLQGEVGSGKTVVAGHMAALILAQGRQVAFLAPTELLARQHYDFLSPIFRSLGHNPALLTGALPLKEKREVLKGLAEGSIGLVVGTQALLSKSAVFKDLGLAIIDEQQRFGVRQRLALAQKSPGLDLMSMSATPIPRSLAQVIYGDLDISAIQGSIPGRKPAITQTFAEKDFETAYRYFFNQVRSGEQGFVVAPRVGEDEELETLSQPALIPGLASEDPSLFSDLGIHEYAVPGRLSVPPRGRDVQRIEAFIKERAPDLTVGVVHGRQEPKVRNQVMADFRAKKLDILIATTIIEVGVDVPGANVMLVEAAEFFGLSQLHQLRGRIGRGGGQGLFLALLSPHAGDKAQKRLTALKECQDGYLLAEKDLKLRGPGEEMGFKQSGWPSFSFVKLPQDLDYLPQALALADDLWPKLKNWPDLAERLTLLAQELAVLPQEIEGSLAV